MKIIIDTDSTYAPCAYLICAIDDSGDWDTRDESRTVLVQSDWDHPGIASTFGWTGDQDDPESITDAGEYLDSIAGDPAYAVEDPGYLT
tara:strand:- start:1218 stop:1484 length:267 start_codon:yes stop_codon:yes gene_type:complete